MRQEGDTTLIPIYKEVFEVGKKLLLVEELYITKKSIESTVMASDTLRKKEVTITRIAKYKNNFLSSERWVIFFS